jgi:hypothetical protein
VTVDRAELRKLLAEATPGRWRPTKYTGGAQVDGPSYCVADCIESEHHDADAALIAAAVNALPDLLDELDALRVRVAELESDVQRRIDESNAHGVVCVALDTEKTARVERLEVALHRICVCWQDPGRDSGYTAASMMADIARAAIRKLKEPTP